MFLHVSPRRILSSDYLITLLPDYLTTSLPPGPGPGGHAGESPQGAGGRGPLNRAFLFTLYYPIHICLTFGRVFSKRALKQVVPITVVKELISEAINAFRLLRIIAF